VASRVGGLPELVGEDNGALVAAGDVAGLARALGFLIGDRQVLERMGNASAVRAGRYGVEEFLDALEHHYKEVVAQ
jgi:glycosyltransferase involved in cell wall biosynthesis